MCFQGKGSNEIGKFSRDQQLVKISKPHIVSLSPVRIYTNTHELDTLNECIHDLNTMYTCIHVSDL